MLEEQIQSFRLDLLLKTIVVACNRFDFRGQGSMEHESLLNKKKFRSVETRGTLVRIKTDMKQTTS